METRLTNWLNWIGYNFFLNLEKANVQVLISEWTVATIKTTVGNKQA